MSISVQCPGCGKKLKAKDELAGKRIRCPACGKAFAHPGPSAAEQPPSDLAHSIAPKTGTPLPTPSLGGRWLARVRSSAVVVLKFIGGLLCIFACCGACCGFFGLLGKFTEEDIRYEDWLEVGALKPHGDSMPVGEVWAKFRQKPPEAYINGKIVAVNVQSKKESDRLKMPESLRARRSRQVGTILWVSYNPETVRQQIPGTEIPPPPRPPGPANDPLKELESRMGRASFWERSVPAYTATLVDVSKPAVIARVKLGGIGANLDQDLAEFVAYLETLPRRP
jgi:hypothetical protein